MAMKRSGIQSWIHRFLRSDPPRSKSLMVTLFGDSIAPRSGGLWLSELIELLRPFHMNERLVRTSTFRLAEEGWLTSERQGRRSRYLLTDSGTKRIENARLRIYDPPPRQWAGLWTVVVLSRTGNHVADRAELRRELEWEGFGTLAPGIAVHPCADRMALVSVLDRLRLRENAMVLEARDLKAIAGLPANALMAECWNLDALATLYAGFLARFQPVLPMVQGVDEQTAFVLQTLLIHAYRRVVLHAPRFPAELLPVGWPGHAAYDLCRDLYLRVYDQTNRFVARHLDDGSRPIASKGYWQRFGGLKQA
jgi:phenylacetic acid degradation operon negative regulatory protein